MDGCTSEIEVGMLDDVKGSPERLRAKREAKGWSQDKLGKAAGLTGKSVSNHELGKPMRLESLNAYAKALGCKPEELAEPESAEQPGSVPKKFPTEVEILRKIGHMHPTDDELLELVQWVDGGNPRDADRLEREILIRRAGREGTDKALNALAEAVNKQRKAAGIEPWPGPDHSPKQSEPAKQAASRARRAPA